VAQVKSIVGDASPVVVSLDSDHSAEHVYAEMLAYAGSVTMGSYLVVEDGIISWIPEELQAYGSSPLQAIYRYLSERANFEVDAELERCYPQTQCPSGWLRRRN
jgi:cephalosporin hydroxylase